MAFKTDAILWYNNGVWGAMGYGVPNVGNDPTSLNTAILRLVDVTGRNLSGIMHHGDADLRVPPSINTLTRVHKLCLRARSILAGRAVDAGEYDMESTHTTPAPQDFLIYPVPYFKVRNSWLKEWAGLTLNAISEAVQHTENRKAYEISEQFAGLFGQYVHRVYRLMATELFGVAAEAAKALDFTLSDEQLRSYDPSKWFTQTEMIDTPPVFDSIPTEDDLVPVTDGIPASLLVGLERYPTGSTAGIDGSSAAAAAAATGGTAGSESFAAPPSP